MRGTEVNNQRTNENKLNLIVYFLAIYSLIVFALSFILARNNPVVLPISYGDYERTDLFYILAQGNFENPWEFHPELPSLRNLPYFPLPFLIIKIFDIKVIYFSKDMFYVQAWTLGSIILINYVMWKMLKKYSYKFKISFLISFGLFSVPIAFIFTTGNLQGYSTLIIFLAFINSRSKFLSFISTVLTVSFKPHYVIINLANYLHSLRKFRIYLFACFAGGLFSLFGFSLFGDSIMSNIKYVQSSSKMFTSPKPEFLLHLNASLIGNLTAVETYFFPTNISKPLSMKFMFLITMLVFLIALYLLFQLVRSKNYSWPVVFILAGIPTFLTPVTYNYALTLMLIPLVIFFKDFKNNDKFTVAVVQNKLNLAFFTFALFFIFSPKPVHVVIIPKFADTNLFNMVDSFGYILILIVIYRVLKTFTVLPETSKSKLGL